MEREMQQLSDEAFRGFFDVPTGGAGRFWQPAVDIHESEEHLIVKIEIAGAKPDDLQVSLSPDDRVLTVAGVRSEGPQDREGRIRCHQLEVYFGPFERSIPLPGVPVDHQGIAAVYKEGFLTVTLSKRTTPLRTITRVIPITEDNALHDETQAVLHNEIEDDNNVR
jgi:HSP20 family protein